MGSVLAGSRAFIEVALRWRRAFGGAMRQAGIIAAGGVYALRNNVDRLAEDHSSARRLAECLAEIDTVDIDMESVQTNIVVFDIARTGLRVDQFMQGLLGQGVRMSSFRGTSIRAVTHMDVTRGDVEVAIKVVRDLLGG